MTDPPKDRLILEALIESELSASETYRLALEALDAGDKGAGELRRIEGEHRQAAQVLRERCRCPGPSTGAAWSLWTASAEPGRPEPDGAASVNALRAGEEAEIREYEAALENPALGEDTRRLIASMLLPQTRTHLQMLDRFARR